MRVEPVSAYPPATSRTLAEWMDADLAAMHGTDSVSYTHLTLPTKA